MKLYSFVFRIVSYIFKSFYITIADSFKCTPCSRKQFIFESRSSTSQLPPWDVSPLGEMTEKCIIAQETIPKTTH